jgi:hypothetical protein
VAGIPGAVAHSPAGSIAVVSAGEGEGRRILVLHPDGRSWATTATITLPSPRFDFGLRPVEVADLTGDGHDDFLVPLDAADANTAVVVTDEGGRWRLATGVGMSDPYFGREPRVEDGHLVTTSNDCTPSCAEGTTTPVAWRWDGTAFTRAIG